MKAIGNWILTVSSAKIVAVAAVVAVFVVVLVSVDVVFVVTFFVVEVSFAVVVVVIFHCCRCHCRCPLQGYWVSDIFCVLEINYCLPCAFRSSVFSQLPRVPLLNRGRCVDGPC